MQKKFYEFRKQCVNGVVVNNKYHISTDELKEIIDNIVVELYQLTEGVWEIILESNIVDDTNVLHIEKK